VPFGNKVMPEFMGPEDEKQRGRKRKSLPQAAGFCEGIDTLLQGAGD